MDWYASHTETREAGFLPDNTHVSPWEMGSSRLSIREIVEAPWQWRMLVFGRKAKATPTSYWLLGTTAVGTALVLFLGVAVMLVFLLTTSRGEFQRAEHVRAVLMQTVYLEGDLNDASAAVRRLLIARNPKDAQRLAAESASAHARARNLVELMRDAPAQAEALRTLLPVVDSTFDALARMAANADSPKLLNAARSDLARLADVLDMQLEGIRAQQGDILARRLDAADRSLLQAFELALFAAIFAPAFGIAGIWLLRHERGTRQLRGMQREMMHIQRLAVMGETAAMLAHDVSHPLTAANNYLGALRRQASSGHSEDREKLVDLATRAGAQIHRASVILLRLRRFIEKREAERVPEAPAVLIQDAIALLGPLDTGISLQADIEPGVRPVLIDRVQIQQVLVNLMRNAVDAMRNSPKRELMVSARQQDSQTVVFSLADTGSGLSREVADKLFRPFVSSKHEGMGVGLSICRSIVLDHGGTIWAEPNPAGGTIFRFRLPVAPDA